MIWASTEPKQTIHIEPMMFKKFLSLINKSQKMTVSKFYEIYKEDLKNRSITEKTAQEKTASIKKLVGFLGDAEISEIKPYQISQVIATLQANDLLCTARRLKINAHDFFNLGMINGYIDTNPVAHIKTPRAPVRRKRLSIDEMLAVLAYAKNKDNIKWLYPSLLLALTTGQRRGDIVKMKFSDISNGYLHVEQQKTGARIALPLDLRLNVINLSIKEVIDLCRTQCRGSNSILTYSNGSAVKEWSLSYRFHDCLAKSCPESIEHPYPPSFHEIRSLSERLYRKQGIDTQTLLGHSTQAMTDLYNDDRDKEKKAYKKLII